MITDQVSRPTTGSLGVENLTNLADLERLRANTVGSMNGFYFLFTVIPGQSSVRNGTAGSPASL